MNNETSDDKTCDIEFLGDSTLDKKMYDHAATIMDKDLALIPTAYDPQNLDQPNEDVLSKKDFHLYMEHFISSFEKELSKR